VRRVLVLVLAQEGSHLEEAAGQHGGSCTVRGVRRQLVLGRHSLALRGSYPGHEWEAKAHTAGAQKPQHQQTLRATEGS